MFIAEVYLAFVYKIIAALLDQERLRFLGIPAFLREKSDYLCCATAVKANEVSILARKSPFQPNVNALLTSAVKCAECKLL